MSIGLSDVKIFNILAESDLEDDDPKIEAELGDDVAVNVQIEYAEVGAYELFAAYEEVVNVSVPPITFTAKSDIQWRRRDFVPTKIDFETTDVNVDSPKTPLEYFKEYFPNHFFELMAFQTNLYATQKG